MSKPSSPVQSGVIIVLAIASALTTGLILLSIARARSQGPSPQRGQSLTGPAGRTTHASADDLAVLFPAPQFRLIEASGRPLGRDDLRGRVWVANFMFTTCGSICPLMTQSMAEFQEKLRPMPEVWESVRLVSFSVDPERDTPEVLTLYAREYKADRDHWLFLTGDRRAIWPLVKDGFKLPVENDAKSVASPILHSGKFVLVDRAGQIRGYYDGMEEEGRARLLTDIQRVAREPAPATAPAGPTSAPTAAAPAPSATTSPAPAAAAPPSDAPGVQP